MPLLVFLHGFSIFIRLLGRIYKSCSYLYHIWLFPRSIHVSGDIKKNLSPKKDFFQTFSICHWNLNSLVAHNFTKAALLKTSLSIQRIDMFCISGTYLNSSVTEDNLRIPRYDLIRSDHLFNNKRGDASIYYKIFLPLKLIDIIYLTESSCPI